MKASRPNLLLALRRYTQLDEPCRCRTPDHPARLHIGGLLPSIALCLFVYMPA